MTHKAPFPYNQVILANYIVDATDPGAGNDKWTSTTVQTYTVPTGKRWLAYGGYVTRDANETLAVILQDTTPSTVMALSTQGAAIDTTDIFADLPGNFVLPLNMEAGWSVKITAGGAQGAGAKAALFVHEYTHV